ncbi:MAG: hypothetical protein GY754_40760 [bacterium]|nr:hypothetical protein [bacterium]
MGFSPDFSNHALFHYEYLKEMLLERNIRYTKANPLEVAKESYLNEIIKRIEVNSGHLESFRTFYNFCRTIA